MKAPLEVRCRIIRLESLRRRAHLRRSVPLALGPLLLVLMVWNDPAASAAFALRMGFWTLVAFGLVLRVVNERRPSAIPVLIVLFLLLGLFFWDKLLASPFSAFLLANWTMIGFGLVWGVVDGHRTIQVCSRELWELRNPTEPSSPKADMGSSGDPTG